MDNNLEKDLRNDLVDICKRCDQEIKYLPRYFLSMLNEHGAIQTCKILINKNGIGYASGFERLVDDKRLDLSMEYVILKDKYKTLFTAEELEICKRRLANFGFVFSENEN